MSPFKEYIAEQLKGKRLHFKCDCLFPFDTEGIIKGYAIEGNEIIFSVEVNGKIINISENHPKLKVEEL